MEYWVLEAKCGEKYRIENQGPTDTSVPLFQQAISA